MRRSSRIAARDQQHQGPSLVSSSPLIPPSKNVKDATTARLDAPRLAVSAGAGGTKRKKRRRESSDASDYNATADDDATESARAAKRRKPRPSPLPTGAARRPIDDANARTRKKAARVDEQLLHARIFGRPPRAHLPAPGGDRARHSLAYHRPLLLGDGGAREALLAWFDGVSGARAMPWRKAWVDPGGIGAGSGRGSDAEQEGEELRERVARRAYEVWISEVMLQQTRAATAAPYWRRWTARWPTVGALAAARPDEVAAAWRGLGYYGRARRAHAAARLVAADPELRGLLPARARDLARRVPGVGRYTAGAVSAIAFGRAAPLVDGNVLRVLGRQTALRADVKADRAAAEVLWAAAARLVRVVAAGQAGAAAADDGDEDRDEDDLPLSDRPGRWGQALMELGSTVCTPLPRCGACPVTATCRAYAEGLRRARRAIGGRKAAKGKGPGAAASRRKQHRQVISVDIEDACTLCTPLEDEEEEEEEGGGGADVDPSASPPRETQSSVTSRAPSASTDRIRAALRPFAFAFASAPTGKRGTADAEQEQQGAEDEKDEEEEQKIPDAATLRAIAAYARGFPAPAAKKAVREEETVVCVISRRRRRGGEGLEGGEEEEGDGGGGERQFLIRRRPLKGLLAGMWEMPSCTLPAVAGGEDGEESGEGEGEGKEDGDGDSDRDESADARSPGRGGGGRKRGRGVQKKKREKKGKGSSSSAHTPEARGRAARRYAAETLRLAAGSRSALAHAGELASVPWQFSHLRLTMHVHLFELRGRAGDDNAEDDGEGDAGSTAQSRWADAAALDAETMGSGMRKCWALAKEACGIRD
ncbi:DNA glycosylase [Durotheca rogersii]|uniref:DNA glycosylase n=1 Tax=Durotheca rogersii TaxID=419775 RepID=UPI00221EC8ED|nr:DNA glycosylase [Durotheca rogersii]KAI5862277.1 DNA glycosylase [Durotheca rogersii]